MSLNQETPVVENNAIQLINETKEFSQQVLPFFRECLGNRDIDQNYHVISVFGSQSSGKSTLLNLLFNTKFDIMDAQHKRQQTTKGIWLSHTKAINTSQGANTDPNSDIFILDVEGSDGAERGEDQDFERKAALFAISVSEVLLINLWEHQIGLYQGNNMGLLKTVFEVNLSLFGKNRSQSTSEQHKVLLLFVIRDHVGITPMESLSESLTNELQKVWNDLNKPENCENSTIYDFFDLKFVGLGHKILRADKFLDDVKEFGDRFAFSDNKENYYFKPEYHHMLPLDAWTMYSENCWDQIENNKDLDLPTQQILVSRFKTDEILNETMDKYFESFDSDIVPVVETNDREKFIDFLSTIKVNCLKNYDELASRYTKIVYLDNRKKLINKITERFTLVIDSFIESISDNLIESVKQNLKENKNDKVSFNDKLAKYSESVSSDFIKIANEFKDRELIDSDSADAIVKKFNTFLSKKLNELRDLEIKSIISQFKKITNFSIKDNVIPMLSSPSIDVWDVIMKFFEDQFDENLRKYIVISENDEKIFDFQIGLSLEINDTIHKRLRFIAWSILQNTVHDYLKDDIVVSILRDRFENSFRYDSNDSPILWKDEQQIDSSFKLAKEHALEIFNVLCIAKTSDNVEVVPDVQTEEIEIEDDLGIYHLERFAHILNEIQKEKVLRQFRRQINLSVLDAKRSIINTTTHIPVWIYFLIVVLGWNEFMMIIRNPLFVTVLLIGAVGFFFVHKFDLWGPVLSVARTAIGETRSTIKDKLRDFVLDNEVLKKENEEDSYEMKNLDKDDAQNEEGS